MVVRTFKTYCPKNAKDVTSSECNSCEERISFDELHSNVTCKFGKDPREIDAMEMLRQLKRKSRWE